MRRASPQRIATLAVGLLGTLVLGSGCYRSHSPGQADAGMEAAVDAPPDAPPGVDVPFRCDGGRLIARSDVRVDLLFVIDNSPSMAPKQASLAREAPLLADAVAFGDVDRDRRQDFPVPESVHVGVITTDDPALVELGDGAPFLRFDPLVDDPNDFIDAVDRLIRRGATGAPREQPLAMAVSALKDVPPGNATGSGFLRPDSVLLVLILTDEDDCSDEGCWEEMGGAVELCVRNPDDPFCVELCAERPELCDPTGVPEFIHIEDYARTLASLRPAGRMLTGVVAGVPPDLLPVDDTLPDYDAILADPQMAVPVGEEVEPSCVSPERGVAFAPRRLTRFAELLGTDGSLESICDADFASVLLPVINRLSGTVREEACAGH